MEYYFNELIEFLFNQSDIYLYFFLFLSSIVENLFPPIPGDTITALGSFLVGKGRLSYALVFVLTSTGSTIGFVLLFFLGKYFGRDYFFKKNFKFFPAEKLRSSEKMFEKYGYFIVLMNRFLPGIRSVISLASGISNLSTAKVMLFSLISAILWNLIWINIGFLLGNNWDIVKFRMAGIVKNYSLVVWLIVIVFITAFIIKKLTVKKKG